MLRFTRLLFDLCRDLFSGRIRYDVVAFLRSTGSVQSDSSSFLSFFDNGPRDHAAGQGFFDAQMVLSARHCGFGRVLNVWSTCAKSRGERETE